MPVLKPFLQRIDALAVRERVLLSVTAVVVVWLVLDLLWLAPLNRQWDAARQHAQALQTQQQTLTAEEIVLGSREGEDPRAAVREQIEQLRLAMDELDQQLRDEMLDFVAPQQMSALLTDLIAESHGLVMLGLRSEPPLELITATEDGMPTIFRHSMVIELAGDYLALLEYLRTVETMPWQLFWDGLQVDVVEQGEARRFRLRVYTLSLSDAWIGV